MNVREQLERFRHNREWLDKYLGFLKEYRNAHRRVHENGTAASPAGPPKGGRR
jgi:hypothetical protein